MAMLPNLRIGAPPAASGAQTAEEPAAPDLFARLLALLPNGEPAAAESTAVTTTVGIEVEARPGDPDAPESEEGAEASIMFLPTFEMQRAVPGLADAAPASEPAPGAPKPAAAPVPIPTAFATAPAPAAPVAALAKGALRGEAAPVRAATEIGTVKADAPAPQPIEAEAVPEPLRRILRTLQPAAAAPVPAMSRDDEQAPRPATAGPAVAVQAAAPPQPAQQPVSPLAPTPIFAITEAPTPAAPAEPLAPLLAEPAAEAAVERQLEVSADGEWLDQLARDIARTGAGGDRGALRFRLNPETLGQVRIELSQGPEGTTIRIGAETEAARSLIAAAEPRLAAEARAQGLRVAETEVSLTGSDAGSADPQRREEAKAELWLRTARGGPGAGDDPADEPGRTSSDRYA